MSGDEQHVVWERRQAEIWDRIFQATLDVVAVADTLNDSIGQSQLREQLVKAAMGVGAELVRANASNSATGFEKYVDEARMKAIETDYWLRLMYVLQQKDDVQRDLSGVITQYASIISLLNKFMRHTRDEPNVIAKHTKGPKVNL
jgi:four helix bundle protein